MYIHIYVCICLDTELQALARMAGGSEPNSDAAGEATGETEAQEPVV